MHPDPFDARAIEAFFANFDKRMADPDVSEDFKERLRPMRPLLAFNAKVNPAAFRITIDEFLVDVMGVDPNDLRDPG